MVPRRPRSLSACVRSAAHCGAAKGQLETLRILAAHGASLWLRNVRGDFPLHDAVQSGRRDLVLWLLQQRPDAVNAPNNDGRCPLHIAALHNNVEMCKVGVGVCGDASAVARLPTPARRRPSLSVLDFSFRLLSQVLLDCHALLSPVMRSPRQQLLTPLDAALHRGNRGVAKYLQLHGGVPANRLTERTAQLRGGQGSNRYVLTASESPARPQEADQRRERKRETRAGSSGPSSGQTSCSPSWSLPPPCQGKRSAELAF